VADDVARARAAARLARAGGSSLPFFLLAIPAGALADVVDRRRLSLFALAWLATTTALLAALAFAKLSGPGALLALTFAIGVGSALLAPALAAITPDSCRATRSSRRSR
jgi:MFS family permease